MRVVLVVCAQRSSNIKDITTLEPAEPETRGTFATAGSQVTAEESRARNVSGGPLAGSVRDSLR